MEPFNSYSEFYTVLRASLKATSASQINESLSIAATEDRDTRFRRLIEGILYSRKFIVSYQAVIVCILLSVTLVNWGSNARRWKGRRVSAQRNIHRRIHVGGEAPNKIEESLVNHDHGHDHSGSSSSCSTLVGAEARYDERSVLLQKSSASPYQSLSPKRVRAWLVHQPPPIPWVNKTMPSNATTLCVLALLGLNIFYTVYNVPFSISMLFIFADRASLVFVANLPWLYLLAAKNQPIKILTGYSYESLNIFHRRLGEIMCLLALLHSVGLIGVWYTILRPTGVTLLKFLLSKIILLGIGAFIAYETLYLTSLGSFRQRWYELFLGLHILLQVLGLVFVWFHHHSSRVYVGIALAIFLIDRLLYRMVLKNRSFRGSIQVKDDNETTVLSTLVPLRERGRVLSYLTGSGITYGWKATEHVFVTIPSLSRKHIIQAHPFTIASKAPSIGDTEVSLELIIRAQDGFSGDLVKYAKIHDSAVIRFDGPYGSQSAVQMLQDSDSCIVVAGGSGIAVAWPLVWSLLPTQHHTDLEHFGRNGLPKKILLVWIVQRRSHLTWIDKAKLNELQAKVDVIIPEPTVEHGRPDVENIIQSWISSHDGASSDGRDKIGIVCSGPDGMNRAVRNTCSSLLRQGRDVSVEVEKFGW